MKLTHTHVEVKGRGGRPTEAHKRCLGCRYTTGTKNRKNFVSCPLGNSEGGRVCLSCKSLIPPGTEDNCHTWHKILSSDTACKVCLKLTNDLANCVVCDQPACISCCLIESWNLFCDTGKEAVICRPCIPPAALVRPDNIPNFCILCSGPHPADGSLPRCLDQNYKGTRLSNNLRAGRHFNASSVHESQSVCSIDTISYSCHSEQLPHSSAIGGANSVLPPMNFNLSDTTFERTFTDRNPAATEKRERDRTMHPSLADHLPPRVIPNRPTCEHIRTDQIPANIVKFDQQLEANLTNHNFGNFSLTKNNLDEARVNSMITQSLLPISNQLLAVSAGIRGLESSLHRLNRDSSDSVQADLPNTICTQTSSSDRIQAKLAFDGKLEPLSCLAFEQGLKSLADSLSKLMNPAFKEALPNERGNLEIRDKFVNTNRDNPEFNGTHENNPARMKYCDSCGAEFFARQPFHALCQSCFSERSNNRRQRSFNKRY